MSSTALMLVLAVCAASVGADKSETPRIVTLGGSVTETVHALGAWSKVVGVDKSSLYPPEAGSKPNVGYFRAFSAEGVLSLNPSLVLAAKGSGPAAALAQLRSTGIRVELIDSERSTAAARARVTKIAEILGLSAAPVLKRMDDDIARAAAVVAKTELRPRVLFIYARGSGTLNVAGQGTGANEIIRLAGGINAVVGFEGYRPLTAEAVVTAAPDVLLLTEHGLRQLGGQKKLLGVPGVALTPAARKGRIITMDDLLLLGFGPRVGQAAGSLARLLHPELGP